MLGLTECTNVFPQHVVDITLAIIAIIMNTGVVLLKPRISSEYLAIEIL